MQTKHVSLVLAVLALQAIFVCAKPPDWVPPELLEMVQGDKTRCMSEHGTTQELIDQVNDGNIMDDRSIGCYMYCMMDAFSMVDEDGTLDSEMLLSVLPDKFQETAVKVMDACSNQPGADGCEKILNAAKCVKGMVPDLWFMV